MKRKLMFLLLAALTMLFFITLNGCGGGGGAENSTSNSGGTIVTPPPPAPRLPGSPTNVVAVAGNGQATITFDPPADDGGSPIIGYIILVTPASSPSIMCFSTSHTITGLTNNTTLYKFSVGAVNSVGTSVQLTESNSVLPRDPAVKWFPDGNVTAMTSDESGNVFFNVQKNSKPYLQIFRDGLLVKEVEVASTTNYRVEKMRAASNADRLFIFAINGAYGVQGAINIFTMTKDGVPVSTKTIFDSLTLRDVSLLPGENEFDLLFSKTSDDTNYLTRFDLNGGRISADYKTNELWAYSLKALEANSDMLFAGGIKHGTNNEDIMVIYVMKRDLTVPLESQQRDWYAPGVPKDLFTDMAMGTAASKILFVSGKLQQIDKTFKLALFKVGIIEGDWGAPIYVPDPAGDGEFKHLITNAVGDVYGVYLTPTGTNQLLHYSGGTFTKVTDLKTGVSGISLVGNLMFIMYNDTNNPYPARHLEVYDVSSTTNRIAKIQKNTRLSTGNKWRPASSM